MSFHVGQKVTMIEDGVWHLVRGVSRDTDDPKFGVVYVVTDFRRSPIDGDLYLRLLGFSALYLADRFRPVVERKTDISIFTRMLDPARVPEPVA